MPSKAPIFLLAALATFTTGCSEPTLSDLLEQLNAPGNTSTQVQACNYSAIPNLNPEIKTAYIFNYEDYKIIRLSNAGLSCGELLARPTDSKEGCAIPRYTWQYDIGLPLLVNPVGAKYPFGDRNYPEEFWSLEPGHNYCGGNSNYAAATTEGTLHIKSTGPNCLLGELKGVGELPIMGNDNQVRKVNLDGAFPVQLCEVKSPEVSQGFVFELAKAAVARRPAGVS